MNPNSQQQLKITCAYSGITLSYAINTSSNKPLTLLHPIVLTPLSELEKILASGSEQSHTTCHLLFTALLARAPQVRFHQPLPVFPLSFYQLHLARLLTQVQRCTRITALWPGLAISKEFGETCILSWLESCEAIDSPHLASRQEALETEIGIQKIIEYIWNTPAIRAKQEWLERKLAKHLPPQSIAQIIQQIQKPEFFAKTLLQQTKETILDFCSIGSEHDGNMLTAIITKLDAAIIEHIKKNQLLRQATAQQAFDALAMQELETLERTTHWKNNNAIGEAKAAIAQPSVPLVTALSIESTAAMQEPSPQNFPTPIAYKIALAKWKAAKALATPNS